MSLWSQIKQFLGFSKKKSRTAVAADREKAGLVDAMPDAVIMLDLNGTILLVNLAMTKMLGYKPEERIGKRFNELTEFIKAEDIEKFMKLSGELIEGGEVGPVETVLRAKDGREIPTSVTYSLIKDAEGNPKNIIATLRDITELKRAEEERVKAVSAVAAEQAKLEATEKEREYIESIIGSMSTSLVVVNPDATIRSVNKATCDLLEYSEEELIGEKVEKIFGAAAESIFKGIGLEKLIKEGTIKDKQMMYLIKKGEEIPVAVSGRAMKNEEGKLDYIVVVAKDMREILKLEEEKLKTERVAAAEKEKTVLVEKMAEKLKEEVKEKTQKIREVERLRERFMADASHELRTPLAVLQTNLDLLGQLSGSERSQEIKDLIESSNNRTKHLAVIIEELSLLSKGEKLEELRETINLKTISEETIEELQPLADAKNINCQIKILDQDLEVMGDETMLRKVTSNLVSNAIKYGRKRGGRVKITLRKQSEEAEFEVADNGIGISKKDLPHIFERFYRIERRRSKEKGGVGLGLAICKWIVELHGGRIEVESKYGKGSKFKVFLPIKGTRESKIGFWDYKLRKISSKRQ